ncbi:MAG: hypothetical protein JSW13_00710 [Candidatus Aerophobus sp.]|nr:MAG: hypothetical protein JSW13_00710 [Candidatus Aerophobus sp.]
MKKTITSLVLLVCFIALMATSATKEEIEASIDAGIAWLVAQQNADGSWGYYSYYQVASTGLAVIKLEDRAFELGFDSPFDPGYPYSANVIAGLDFLFSNAHTISIIPQPAGNPDTNGNNIGVYIARGYYTYETGIALMAIAGSRDPSMIVTTGPLSGWTYGQVIQDMVDYLAFGQTDAPAPDRGGWGYIHNQTPYSDNSNSGYAVLGLDFAESPTFGFNATVPAFVKSELNFWINNIQDPVNGDTNDGGSWYRTNWSWVNILKTGNLIYQMAFYGDTQSAQRVIEAVDYIERHWNDNNTDPGFRGYPGGIPHYQSMYCLMKGLERMGIETINVGGSDIDWFDEISTIIVDSQNADGSWPRDRYDYGYPYVLTAGWALLTLERVVPAIIVPIDIKPGSCPNPLNLGSKGVLPVAVLGTEDFDVTDIDPTTIQLTREGVQGGVPPLRWSYEDVATPFEGELCDCHDLDGDGYIDLTLKFDTQELVNDLELVTEAGNTIPLILIGKLKEEAGGRDITGSDCIRVR